MTNAPERELPDTRTDPDEPLWSGLDQLARALHVQNGDLDGTLQAIVDQAVLAIAPADYAGLIVIEHGRLAPRATFGTPPVELDELQRRSGDGPCLDAARDQAVCGVDDTADDARWTEFCARAAALGVASVLCVPLWVDATTLGTLSLYSERVGAFTDAHTPLVTLFATLAALALADARRTEQLTAALVNRDVIGQAKGILVERWKLTPDAAFARLSIASQRMNRKLVDVARHLAETGEILGDPGPADR